MSCLNPNSFKYVVVKGKKGTKRKDEWIVKEQAKKKTDTQGKNRESEQNKDKNIAKFCSLCACFTPKIKK